MRPYQVVGHADGLHGAAEHKFAGMQDKTGAGRHVHFLGQVRLTQLRIDVCLGLIHKNSENRPRRRSMLEGWIAVSSSGFTSRRPDAIASRRARSLRTTRPPLRPTWARGPDATVRLPSEPSDRPSVILAVDQGTTGTTTLVVDERARIVGRGYAPVTQSYPRPGWVEHDPRQIWDGVQRSVRQVLEAARLETVEAIGITNQRETAVAWDAASLEPFSTAIVWQGRPYRA